MNKDALTPEAKPVFDGNNLVCIVDDGFITPALEAGIETNDVFLTNDIKEMISKNWDEVAVQSLCSNLLEAGWDIQAFSHPNFYENKLEKNVYISDILVFDWEYLTGEVGQVDILKRILSNYPIFIYIFSGVDKGDQIEQMIKEELNPFKDRVCYLSKNDDCGFEETARRFSDALTDKKKNNFSFSFGSTIRNVVAKSIENILVKFVDIDMNNLLRLLSHEQSKDELDLDVKKIISSKVSEYIKSSTEIKEILCQTVSSDVADEFMGIIEGKVKNSIVSAQLVLPDSSTPTTTAIDENIIRQLWSFRLYHKPRDTDKIVRTGDIIQKNGESTSKLYLVITDNCSLSRFSKKTGGIINTVMLEKVSEYSNPIKICG